MIARDTGDHERDEQEPLPAGPRDVQCLLASRDGSLRLVPEESRLGETPERWQLVGEELGVLAEGERLLELGLRGLEIAASHGDEPDRRAGDVRALPTAAVRERLTRLDDRLVPVRRSPGDDGRRRLHQMPAKRLLDVVGVAEPFT